MTRSAQIAASAALAIVAAASPSLGAHIGSYSECPFSRMAEPFLNTGYRINYTLPQCLHSAVEWHNETLSIWTHVLALMFFVCVGIRMQLQLLSPERSLWPHRAIFGVFSATASLSMTSSVIFHTVRSSSEALYARLSTVDFTCIALSLAGMQFGQAWYVYDGRPRAQRVSVCLLSIVTAASVAYTSVPLLTSPLFRVLRTCVFASAGSFMFWTTAHASWGKTGAQRRAMWAPMAQAYVWAALSVAVYLMRWPESRWPETFDCTLHSHVLMHVFCFLGQLRLWLHYIDRYTEVSARCNRAVCASTTGDPSCKTTELESSKTKRE